MKTIAFYIRDLAEGGTEVSLVNLLNAIHDQYDITLFVGSKTGHYLANIPKTIKIIEVFDKDYKQLFDPISKGVRGGKNILLRKIIGKIFRKVSKKLYYRFINRFTIKTDNKFDYCIDYQGYGFFGTYYCIKSIDAIKKITFIHDEDISWIKPIKSLYRKYDYCFCVSRSCIRKMEDKYPFAQNKTRLCRNVLNVKKIIDNSMDIVKEIDSSSNTILTIGRLEYQKGYDLLIEVASKMRANGLSFKWYVIGDGSLRKEIVEAINKAGLSKNVILLGAKSNPYPYIKRCHIYAQTSRHEGYGMAIAEARILNKPIISTDIDCVREQISNNENGILSRYDTNEYYSKICSLLSDKKLQETLVKNLLKENKKESIDFVKYIK